MSETRAQTKRTYRLQPRAQGKNRFIRREILGNLVLWAVVPLAVERCGGHWHPFSSDLFISWLALVPIAVLLGYLTGCWKMEGPGREVP